MFKKHFYDAFNKHSKESVKYINYLDQYDFYFDKWKDKNINILEIGVREGGGLYTLREYFPNATIYGIDINKECKKHENKELGIHVIIGDQTDKKLLKELTDNITFDIVIDDGSHKWSHQRKTFEFLYDKINFDGLYVVEGLITSYYYLNKKAPNNWNDDKKPFIEYLKNIINNINWWANYTDCFRGPSTKVALDLYNRANNNNKLKTFIALNTSFISFSAGMCIIHKKKVNVECKFNHTKQTK